MNGNFGILLRHPKGLVVVQKPAGMYMDIQAGNLLDKLRHALGKRDDEFLAFCHQLDFATSGLICFAESSTAASKISTAFMNKQVVKKYAALLEGHLSADETAFDWPIALDSTDPNRFTQIKGTQENPGRSCLSLTKVLSRTYINDFPVSLVEFSLISGRRHQLRLHASLAGHPIYGDVSYGSKAESRLMLHAKSIKFPFYGETVKVESKAPFAENIEIADGCLISHPIWRRAELAGAFAYCRIQGDVFLLFGGYSRVNSDGKFIKGRWMSPFIDSVTQEHCDNSASAADVLFRHTGDVFSDFDGELGTYEFHNAAKYQSNCMASLLRRGGDGYGFIQGVHDSRSVVLFITPVPFVDSEVIKRRVRSNLDIPKTLKMRQGNVSAERWDWIRLSELQSIDPKFISPLLSKCIPHIENFFKSSNGKANKDISLPITIPDYSPNQIFELQ